MTDRTQVLEYVKKNYTYDPVRGVVLNRRGRVVKGSRQSQGYMKTKIYLGKECFYLLMHHVVWMLVYGRWPTQIDHLNGIKTDNRIGNLREVTAAENCENRVRSWRPNAATGLPSICLKKGCKSYKTILWNKDLYFGDKYEAFITMIRLGRMYGDS